MCRLIIYGGRDFDLTDAAFIFLDAYHDDHMDIDTLVSGGAAGADTIGYEWGKLVGLEVDEHLYKADWSDLSEPCVIRQHSNGTEFNVLAGLNRNKTMLIKGKPKLAVEFPGGRGTANMRKLLKDAGITPTLYS